MTSISQKEFDACFDQFTVTVFRLEVLQTYAVGGAEGERLRAFREGLPRPERSVRTDPWLKRIAVSTAAGKRWQRVHIVEHPLSEYIQYELVSYVESQAAGEQICLADRGADDSLAALDEDFWLFDDAYVVFLKYDAAGRWLKAEYSEDPAVVASCRAARDAALAHSQPLNTYLAGRRDTRHVA